MTAAVVAGPRRAAPAAVPRPVAGPGEVLVRVEGCGVCGSSLPVWEGRDWFGYPLEPGAPGHEVWGRLADGTRVAARTFHGFAEWDVAPAAHVVEILDDGLPFPGEAIGCAVNIALRASVGDHDRVAVVGMGFIGTAVARLLGPRVVEVRRGEDPGGEFEVVIEAAGTQGALDTASRLVAPGGRLVIAGFHQDGPRVVDLQSWNWRGLDVVNAHERAPAAIVAGMREAARLAAAGGLDVAALVTHTFALDEVGAAFEAASSRGPGFLKAVVCPSQ